MQQLRPGTWNIHRCPGPAPRLDSYLALTFSLSRARIQKLVNEEYVRWNGKIAKSNQKLEEGDELEIFYPEPKEIGLKAESIPLTVLFQDSEIAVVEKPAGLVVHPAVGHWEGTLVNALLHHFGEELSKGKGISGELRPGIVHRIDQFTSGILLVTKTDEAHQSLSKQFKDHSITRKYIGACYGALPSKGEWKDAIGRDPKDRKRMAQVPEGRTAHTKFITKEIFLQNFSLFEAELFTGRTHQIRVHFSSAGFPLLGDSTYQNATRKGRMGKEAALRAIQKKSPEFAEKLASFQTQGRQFLHAAHLGFVHPKTQEKMEFKSELPEDLANLLLEAKKWKK